MDPVDKQPFTRGLQPFFEGAASALDQCGTTADCYVTILGEPVPSTPHGRARASKAAFMAGVLGNDATRKALVMSLAMPSEEGIRDAVLRAVAHLAPKGDAADAASLERLADAGALPRAYVAATVTDLLRARAE
jgi:hypothetical protein